MELSTAGLLINELRFSVLPCNRGTLGLLVMARVRNCRIEFSSSESTRSLFYAMASSRKTPTARSFPVIAGLESPRGADDWVGSTTFANIPGPPRASWLKGYFSQVFNRNGWKFHHELVEKYGSVVRVPMAFGYEDLYVTDPLALHYIIVKDQYIYEETSAFITTNGLIFGTSLLSTLGLVRRAGDHHRKQRKMLNPVFSLKHMRDLLPIFNSIAHELRDALAEQARDGTKEFDVMHWLSRAALEFIGQGGFGHAFNALRDEEATKYSAYVKKIGQATMIYRERKIAVESGDDMAKEKVGMGKDILSILLKANMVANENDRLPEEEVIGQLNTFILAGQETTSHAIARTLYLLSQHPDVQSRLRDEITVARKERGGSDFDYDTLMALPYLDAVCRETLRVYPPVSIVIRTTRKDVILPLAWPILSADGKTEIAEIPIKKNTNVIVSIIGSNRSKRIWGDDAEEWKPDRWLSPLPESVAKAHMPGVYSSMMTFIGGGRACIGFKFAEMELKLVLSMLLESFKFELGAEVEWQMSGVARPTLKGSADKSSMLPLKVSALEEKL
ncbi:cytochrome P450 [Sanghuangporus baumii]|uniref:Cytochrome P450 n=1 Tax=Sanghuangporus baumii TaxID=108892 RepID=A0A9Q5HXF6_SANBA|nr:cytochrome P450 [Sanghuangporus baumii]